MFKTLQLTLIVVLSIILFSGLTLKDFSSKHTASVLTKGGLAFTKYSLVRTDPIDTVSNNIDLLDATDATIKTTKRETLTNIIVSMVVSKFGDYDDNGFQILAALSSDNESQQISIGQWKNSILVLVGDDYRNTKGYPILIFEIPHTTMPTNTVTLHFSQKMAYIEFNGSIMHSDDTISWKLPEDSFIVTLGNTLKRTNAWLGVINEFKLSSRSHQSQLIEKSDPDGTPELSIPTTQSLLHYKFQKQYARDKHIISNLSSEKINLYLESAWTISSFNWLSEASRYEQLTPNILFDRVLNFFGFIPLGFLLMHVFYDRQRLVFIAVVTCCSGFTISLFIETVQALVPSRVSSFHDLGLNSAGTIFGCLAAITLTHFLERYTAYKKLH